MLQKYIHNLNRLYQTGNAREHSYRGDLQELLNSIIDNKDIVVTNEQMKLCKKLIKFFKKVKK